MLTRHLRDLDLAEDAQQDAFAQALESWPRDGVPANPDGWLMTVARHRATDAIRRRRSYSDKLRLLAATEAINAGVADPPPSGVADDRLRLVFTCCHPALARDVQVALALRHLCGLTTAEAARLFLVPVPTMAARLTRAKKKIATARIPYRIPADDELPGRLSRVLAVVYLLFTEGYAASSGDRLVRAELTERAIGMGRLLVELMPDETEVAGLQALMLLQDARRETRVDADGRLVLLDDQDRERWDRAGIDEGLVLLGRSFRKPGPYALQAAIAAEHATAARSADTDWSAIVRWYDLLLQITPTPVVAMNRAVAVAMRDGPRAGLALLDPLLDEPALSHHHLLHGARAQLLRRAGQEPEARAAFVRAGDCARTEVERDFYAEQFPGELSV